MNNKVKNMNKDYKLKSDNEVFVSMSGVYIVSGLIIWATVGSGIPLILVVVAIVILLAVFKNPK